MKMAKIGDRNTWEA